MNCLHCAREIPVAFFDSRTESPEFKGGRFSCPHCGAEHIRRNVGKLPNGEPLHNFRLWGHLKMQERERPASPATPPSERRKRTRHKSWR